MRFLQHVLAAVGLTLVAMSASAEPQAGKDYRVMGTAQSTDSGKKVEVTEFFSYTCPHCYAFDAPLTEWVKKQGDKIAFKRVPVSFRDSWVPQQKLYYTVEAMGKSEELHSKIFSSVHQQHQPIETDAGVAELAVKLGLDKAKFTELYSSFGVQSKVRRAAQLQEAYQIDSVPSVAVDGRFVTSPALVGASVGATNEKAIHASMLETLDFLVNKTSKDKKGSAVEAKPEAKPAAAAPAPEAKKPAKKAAKAKAESK